MHLLIPFAFCSSDGCAQALPTRQLPHLQKLLACLTPEPLETGDEFSLSTPHECALAQALGIPIQDGLIPRAALEASKQAASNRHGARSFITRCHWQVGANHIAMSGQALPNFSALERGDAAQLTLCGERSAQTFTAQPQTFFKKFMNIFGTQPPSNVLEQL